MKTHTDYLYFTTKNKKEIINITNEVREIVKKSGVKEGMALVSAMHITLVQDIRKSGYRRVEYQDISDQQARI
jgi:thiamine phosphate synthase YjbQ (UPF0047 family)